MFLPHATRPPARRFLILCRMQADKACGLSCAAKVLDRLTPVSPVRHPFFPSPSVVPPTRQGNPQPVPPRQIPWPRPSPPSAGRTPNRPLRSDGVGLHAVAFRPWRLCVQSHVATRWRRPARRRPPPPSQPTRRQNPKPAVATGAIDRLPPPPPPDTGRTIQPRLRTTGQIPTPVQAVRERTVDHTPFLPSGRHGFVRNGPGGTRPHAESCRVPPIWPQ